MLTLPRSSPEAQGVPSRAIHDLVEAFEAELDAAHSLLIVRHGHVVAEGWWAPYAAEHPHSLYSLSKSFTSSAIGFAVAEGLLTVDDFVVALLPDDAPTVVSDNLARMRVRHLLTMSTGHKTVDSDVRGSQVNWAQAILGEEIAHEPGTRFMYDSGATYLLSAILQRLTGQTLTQYLTPRLFEPLGIDDPYWESCPRGINTGGWGLHLRTEDVAKLGQLYLQRGSWNGTQLLSEQWVAEATSAQVPTPDESNPDWVRGYGYQFWTSTHGYRADGAFGQFCLVLPEFDTVVALSSGVGNAQVELDQVWKHLVPALSPTALPEATADHEALKRKLSSLDLRAPASHTDVELGSQRFELDPNDSPFTAVSIAAGEGVDVVTLWKGEEPHAIRSGRDGWEFGVWSAMGSDEQIAARGGWSDDATLRVRIVSYHGPFVFDLEAHIANGVLQFGLDQNLALGSEPFRLHATGTTSPSEVVENRR